MTSALGERGLTPKELESTFLSRVARTITSQSGEEALELALQERPDVVVSDLHMPGMMGENTSSTIATPSTTNAIVGDSSSCGWRSLLMPS